MTDTARSKPGRRDIDITLNPHDAVVFRAHLRRDKSTQGELLSRIVHEWATHPSRFPGNLSLPAQNSVLFEGESLRSYLTRVALATINAVFDSERNMKATARRLRYERTAFHKLFSRLKAGKKSPACHVNSDGDGNGFLSLETMLERHVHYALELCIGDKYEACTILEITLSKLNMILNAAPTGNGKEALIGAEKDAQRNL